VFFDQEMMGDVLVLTPRKNLVGGEETTVLLKAIDDFVAGAPGKVIMDMGEINWVSSLGLGMMRRASITCDRSDGWLRLARIGRLIENSLLVTGLMIYFESFETVEAAVQAPPRDAQRWSAPRNSRETPGRPEA